MNIQYTIDYRYKDTVLTEIKSSMLHLEEEDTEVALLATSTKLFIWVISQAWNNEPSALWEAANVKTRFCIYLV